MVCACCAIIAGNHDSGVYRVNVILSCAFASLCRGGVPSGWLQLPPLHALLSELRRFIVAGHKNVETVKGVTFFGGDEEYVASGSDCGNLFVWSKRDGLLRCMQPGDSHILNCIAPHPTQPFTLATSGAARWFKMMTPSPRPAAVAVRGLVCITGSACSLCGVLTHKILRS